MMDTIERREMWTHSIVAMKPLASSAIMTNNIASRSPRSPPGMLAGLGTVYMMLFNGLLIGVIGCACHRAGMSVRCGASSRRTARSSCRRSSSPAAPACCWPGLLRPALLAAPRLLRDVRRYGSPVCCSA